MLKLNLTSTLMQIACSLAISAAVAQNAGGNFSAPLESFADSLRARGIDTSWASLIAALRNRNPEIRSLAALKLAEDHNSGAISPIEEALSNETDPSARIGIAGALWSLQDPKGLRSLQAMCSDPSLSVTVLVDVVQHRNMISESSAQCADPILVFLDAHGDSESRQKVLPALPRMYEWLTGATAAKTVRVIQDMLFDKASVVRIQAADALAHIGSHSSLESMKRAIANEKDPAVRHHLQNPVDRMER